MFTNKLHAEGNGNYHQNHFDGNHGLHQHGNGVRGSKLDRYHYGFYRHPKYELEGLERSNYKDDTANLDDLNGNDRPWLEKGYEIEYQPKSGIK